MEYDILDFASEIIDMATDNYYRMETLRGYCENLEGEELNQTWQNRSCQIYVKDKKNLSAKLMKALQE